MITIGGTKGSANVELAVTVEIADCELKHGLLLYKSFLKVLRYTRANESEHGKHRSLGS